jgi:hypothetical protein
MSNLTPELKAEIDGMSKEQLLHAYETDPLGSERMSGDAGIYLDQRLKALGVSEEQQIKACFSFFSSYFGFRRGA